VYGTSINSYWMQVDDEKEADKYIRAVKSKLFSFLFQQCKYSGFNNILLLKNFPEISVENLYAFFDLSQEEVNYIENYAK
jgi:hypothetical protein